MKNSGYNLFNNDADFSQIQIKSNDLNYVRDTNLISGFAVHPLYSGFSSANIGFVFNNASGLVSVSDTVIYAGGYYSINGSAWQNFTLAGNTYNGNANWLNGTTTYTLPLFGIGEHYIIAYSCTYNNSNSSWDCHDNKWQLIVINNTPTIIPNCTDNCSTLGYQCGTQTICGSSVNCGNCTFPQTCNATNMCSCTPETNAAFCSRLNKNCGNLTALDNCGILRTVPSCGICSTGYTCNANGTCIQDLVTEWTEELMINGGFEWGNLTGWTISNPGWSVGTDAPQGSNSPQSGNYCAFFSLFSSNSNYYIYQDVNLTNYASSIDAGGAKINVSGYGISTDYTPAPEYWDRARIQFIFLNSAKGVISNAKDTGYVNSQNWWKANLSEYTIPPNTRYVRVWANTYENAQPSGNLDSFSVKVNAGPCTDTCSSLGYNCGSVCGFSCGNCSTGYYCLSGHCTACITHASSNCSNGDVYWWNSCGQIEEIRYDCNSTQICTNGACVNIVPTSALVANHNAVAAFDYIPVCWINRAKEMFSMTYHHTSHGSQIPSGMDYLINYVNPSLYSYNSFFTDNYDTDLGNGEWPAITIYDFNHDSSLNSAMWSWCGQVGDYPTYNAMNSHYLAPAESLVDNYNIDFIYMTGHLDEGGSGPTGSVYAGNNIIRQHVEDIDGILFDFADIESYDPAGNYYPYGTDACNWCYDWCDAHPEDCENMEFDCAHSHPLNCVRKAKAFWWMMARLAGWDGTASDPCP